MGLIDRPIRTNGETLRIASMARLLICRGLGLPIADGKVTHTADHIRAKKSFARTTRPALPWAAPRSVSSDDALIGSGKHTGIGAFALTPACRRRVSRGRGACEAPSHARPPSAGDGRRSRRTATASR